MIIVDNQLDLRKISELLGRKKAEKPRINYYVNDLRKISELLGRKKAEKPRINYYVNEGRFDNRFTHYFFNGLHKVTISKEVFAEAGVEVNWFIAKFGGKIGGKKGETVEIDINEIPTYNKAFLVEYYLKDRGLLIDPVNGDIIQEEVLYKPIISEIENKDELVIGESYIIEDLDGYIKTGKGEVKLEGIIDKKVMRSIENERSRQEKRHKKGGGQGKMYVWILPSSNRTVASIFSTTKIDTLEMSSYGGFRNITGFIGAFESKKPIILSNAQRHTILFLTPWWIWHY